MKEDFLHYLWKFKKYDFLQLKTTDHQQIEVLNPGQYNLLAGPDFFNAQLRIGQQRWAGNVEIHLKSSDWYAHGHENDAAYDNVILHVVWEHDVEVYAKANCAIPTVKLSDFVSGEVLQRYFKLFNTGKKQFVNCEKDFAEVPETVILPWIERLFFERLERKVREIETLLEASANDWEAVLFKMLARNFGTKINAASFINMAEILPFAVVRKCSSNENQLENLLLGTCDLLPETTEDAAVLKMKKEYEYLVSKFGLNQKITQPVQFFKLRPQNFPTVRMSQLAQLYESREGLFSQLISAKAKEKIYEILQVETSDYWQAHYTFAKSHPLKRKKLSTAFIDLLIINTIVPLKFAFWRKQNEYNEEALIGLLSALPIEKNSIVNGFLKLRPLDKNALTSQAILQLKKEYCDKNRCLHCRVGNYLISDNPKL